MGKTFRKDSQFRPNRGRGFDKQPKKFDKQRREKWKPSYPLEEIIDPADLQRFEK